MLLIPSRTTWIGLLRMYAGVETTRFSASTHTSVAPQGTLVAPIWFAALQASAKGYSSDTFS